MQAKLLITAGRDEGKSFKIFEGEALTIGRSLENEVCLLDEKASRMHCKLLGESDGFHFCDLDSLNGVYVGGEKVVRRRLKHGDRLLIGATEALFLLDGQPAPAPILDIYRRAAAFLPLTFLGKALTKLLPWMAAASFGLAMLNLLSHGLSGTSAVSVVSSPSRAMVYIDGNFVGQTPLKKVEVPRGVHLVQVRRHGYETYQTKLELGIKSQPIDAALEPQPTGSLEVASEPPGAEVYLDQEYRGQTPLVISGLAFGEHDLRLNKPEHLSVRERVKIDGGKSLKREIALKLEIVQFYENQIDREPNNASHYSDLAHIYILNQNFEEAIDALEIALIVVEEGRDISGYGRRVNQELVKAYNSDHYDYGDFNSRVKFCRALEEMMVRVIDQFPTNFQNYKTLRDWYNQGGRWNEVLKLWERAYKKQPNMYEPIGKEYATSLMNARRYEETKAVLKPFTQTLRKNYEVFYKYGVASLKSAKSAADRAEAASSLERALKYCPSRGPVGEIQQALREARR